MDSWPALARSLGKRASIRRERNLDELSSYLSEHERQTLVIVMDDAQNSTHGTLEELRLLLGLNLPSQPTFALILIGDEYLLGQLQLRNHRALCSRLSAHHMLSPWTFEEIQIYLKTGLEAVGINRSKVFEPAAVDLLVRATAGVPRSVCLLGSGRLAGSGSGRRPGNQRPNHATGHGTGARTGGPDSPQLMIERIQQAHALYCRLTGQRVSLRFDRERLWYELFHAGFNEADLQRVIRYLQREIREGRRNVGALKLSNLLQIDRFEEDLNISRVQLYAPKPSKPPPQRLTRRHPILRKMRRLANGRCSSWPSGAPNTDYKSTADFDHLTTPQRSHRLPVQIREIELQPCSTLSHHSTALFPPRPNSLICPVAPRLTPLLTPQINSPLYRIASRPA